MPILFIVKIAEYGLAINISQCILGAKYKIAGKYRVKSALVYSWLGRIDQTDILCPVGKISQGSDHLCTSDHQFRGIRGKKLLYEIIQGLLKVVNPFGGYLK